MKILRWTLLTIIGILSLPISATPTDKAKLTISEIENGKIWEIAVCFENAKSTNFTAFQMDMRIPQEFVYEEGSFTTSSRLASHSCDAAMKSNNTLTVVGFSMGNQEIPGNSGKLFTLRISPTQQAQEGSYNLYLQNIKFAKRDGTEVRIANTSIRIKYQSPYIHEIVYWVNDKEYYRQRVREGQAIPEVKKPEKEGHTFAGWEGLPLDMPNHDIQVTAKFRVNTYTITYILDGQKYGEQRVDFGTVITPLKVESTAEKEFTGWENLPKTMPAHDLTIYGKTILTSIEELSAEKIVDVYNLKGKKILSKKSVQDCKILLPKGIYIINGNTYYVK